MIGINAKVPQQNNGYDCGLYTLQFVESFLLVRNVFIAKIINF